MPLRASKAAMVIEAGGYIARLSEQPFAQTCLHNLRGSDLPPLDSGVGRLAAPAESQNQLKVQAS